MSLFDLMLKDPPFDENLAFSLGILEIFLCLLLYLKVSLILEDLPFFNLDLEEIIFKTNQDLTLTFVIFNLYGDFFIFPHQLLPKLMDSL